MGWYDIFSLTYDAQLEKLYRPYREQLASKLGLQPGAQVLDVPCGTGQQFDLLVDAIGESGILFGIDRSKGMLRRAQKRVSRAGWNNVALLRADANEIELAALPGVGQQGLDAVVCALGLTAFDSWQQAFHRLFSLLRPGGRFAILDVFVNEHRFQTRMVEWLARADLSRKAWEPLAAASVGFERRETDAPVKTFGGTLYIATGLRPG